MRGICRVLGLVAVVGAWVAPTSFGAQDWPQWRGEDRDGKASFEEPPSWPEALTKRWSVEVGDGVSSPSLVGDRLYCFALEGGNEVLRCLEAATGEELWKDEFPTRGADGPASGFAGPRAAPAVAQGKVATIGVRGQVSVFDAESGELLWRNEEYRSVPRFCTSSSPMSFEHGGVTHVVAMTTRSVVGLHGESGELLWQTPFVVRGRGYNAATPIVDGNTVLLAGSSRGTRAIVISGGEAGLAAAEAWANEENSVQYNTPILKDGFLYGISSSDVLFCIDRESGETTWSSTLTGDPTPPSAEAGGAGAGAAEGGRRGGRRGGRGGGGGRGGYASIVDAGSVLFALSPKSELIVFEPDEGEFLEHARYKVSESPTYAYPVISGDRVFVKDQNSVTLWTFGTE